MPVAGDAEHGHDQPTGIIASLLEGLRDIAINGVKGVHPITLRFSPAGREHAFLQQHLTASLTAIRLFVFFGSVLYALFGVLDHIIIPDMQDELWLVRVVVVSINCGLVLAATYTSLFYKYSQIILSISMLAAGGGILVMIAVTPVPVTEYYYAGLIMVVIYCSSLIRLHHINALIISAFLILIYQFIAVRVNPIPANVLINNDFFLGMPVILGAFSSYFQELYVRKNYVNSELLAEGKARAERLQEAAESANRAKSEFLAVMSHELRTPLNAIIGFSDIMKEEMFGPIGARYIDYARDISVSGNHLLDIINAILDLSKAEAGKLVLDETSVDLRNVAHACLRVFREIAATGGIRLSLIEPNCPPLVWADERLCKQVALNLVSNAVKFTKSGGQVTISFSQDVKNAWTLCVEDTGIGIAEGDLPRVIEPFVQVDSSLSRQYGGTGLGLPLVRKIAELHSGKVQISSRMGVGTSVSICFPPERSRSAEAGEKKQFAILHDV